MPGSTVHFRGTADYASRSMLACQPSTYADDMGTFMHHLGILGYCDKDVSAISVQNACFIASWSCTWATYHGSSTPTWQSKRRSNSRNSIVADSAAERLRSVTVYYTGNSSKSTLLQS